MEAAPRLAMLSLDLKESRNSPDFRTVFRRFIAHNYGEAENAYDKELNELEGLRNSAVRPPKDTSGCQVLKRYFWQLKMLYPRFPMKENEPAALDYAWQDNFTGKTVELRDPKFEEANILYNIGAMHSLLGAVDRRVDSETMQEACTNFQRAAWAFEHLRDKYSRMPTFDLSFDVLSFYITLMLGQAQECILEKSLLDNRKCTIVAKVAVQVVDYYKECLKTLDNEATMRMPGMENFKEFIPRQLLEIKTNYYQCIVYYQLACQALEGQKWGERISYLEAAAKELSSCTKLIKNCGDDDNCREAIQFVGDIVQQTITSAKKDNDFIYHEKIPDVRTLAPVKGAVLVKGIPLNDSEYIEKDIFIRLVPMSAHERASLYSEKKASLLRKVSEKVENKDLELLSLISAFRLEQLQIPASFNVVPQQLLDNMAAVRGEGDVCAKIERQNESLDEAREEIQEINRKVQVLLDQLQSIKLEKNQTVVLDQLAGEHGRFSAALSAAATSSNDLQHFMDGYKHLLVTLGGSVETVKASLPAIDLDRLTAERADLKELERLMSKVDEMKEQRHQLLLELRAGIQKDDITKQVMVAEGEEDLAAIFTRELEKHDSFVRIIDQNLTAQDNILEAIKTVVERLAEMRALLVTTAVRRDDLLHKYDAAFRAGMVFEEKISEGLEFYQSLRVNLTKLREKADELFKQTPLAVVKPKIVLPPAPPTEAVSSAGQGPTLRDYMNRMKGPSTGAPLPPPASAVPEPSASSGRPTLRDYLDARKGGSVASVSLDHMNNFQVPVDPRSAAWPNTSYMPSTAGNFYPQPDQYLPTVQPSYPHGIASGPYSQPPPSAAALPPLRPPAAKQPPPPSAVQPALYSQTQQQMPASPISHYHRNSVPQFNPNQQTSQHAGSHSQSEYSSQPYNTREGYQGTPSLPSLQHGNHNLSFPNHGAPTHPSYNASSQPNSYAQPQQGPQYLPGGTSHHNPYQGGQAVPAGVAHQNAWTYGTAHPQQPQAPSAASGSFMAGAGHQPPVASGHGGFSGFAQNFHHAGQNPGPDSLPSQQPFDSGRSGDASGNQPSSMYSAGYQVPPISSYNGAAGSAQSHSQNGATTQLYGLPPSSGNLSSASGNHLNGPAQMAQSGYSTAAAGGDPFPAQVCPPAATQHNHPNPAAGTNFTQKPLEPLKPVPVKLPTVSPLDDGLEKLSSVPVMPLSSDKFKMHRRMNSSDELFGIDFSPAPASAKFMQPEVLTIEDIGNIKTGQNDPVMRDALKDPLVLAKFHQNFAEFETEAERLVGDGEELSRVWKQLSDIQERDSRKFTMGVARCYSTKNRDGRVMPYDASRVILQASKNDYINASFVENVTEASFTMIVTQTPLPGTSGDFWTMVLEQGVEVIAAVMTDYEAKEHCYWPNQRQTPVTLSSVTISLQKDPTENASYSIRTLNVTHLGTKTTKSVVHVRFKGWPADNVPATSFGFADFVNEVAGFHRKQRVTTKPLLVHCSLGAGASGVVCAALNFKCSMDAGGTIADLTQMIVKMRNCRKYLVDYKSQLRFLHQVCLTLARRILHQNGLLPSYSEKVEEASPAFAKQRNTMSTPIPDVLSDIRQELQRRSVTPPLQPTEEKVTATNPVIGEGSEKPGFLKELPARLTELSSEDLRAGAENAMLEKKKKITKEDFVNPARLDENQKRISAVSNDPFANLDPFWTMKKTGK